MDTIQDGSMEHPFSFPDSKQVNCRVTRTNKDAEIIRANLHLSLSIKETSLVPGPYCPSIEDKIVRFAEKERHQIYLEQKVCKLMNGVSRLSTSLPFDIQKEVVHSITGLENALLLVRLMP